MSIVLPKDRKKFHLFATHPQWSALPLHILDQIYHYLKLPLSSCRVVVKKERHTSIFPYSEGLYSASYHCMRTLASKNSYWDARLSDPWIYINVRTTEKLFTRGQKHQQKQHVKKTKSQTRRYFNAKNPKIQNRKK